MTMMAQIVNTVFGPNKDNITMTLNMPSHKLEIRKLLN
jgi:hypothetical protein